jgi:hypothetical protein
VLRLFVRRLKYKEGYGGGVVDGISQPIKTDCIIQTEINTK